MNVDVAAEELVRYRFMLPSELSLNELARRRDASEI